MAGRLYIMQNTLSH